MEFAPAPETFVWEYLAFTSNVSSLIGFELGLEAEVVTMIVGAGHYGLVIDMRIARGPFYLVGTT